MPTPAETAERVHAAVTRSLALADQAFLVTGPGAMARQNRMLALLNDADALLGQRIVRWNAATGGASAAFTPASAQAYRAQIRVMTERATAHMKGTTLDAAQAAYTAGAGQARMDLAALEQAYTGIATRAPRIRQAMRFDPSRGRGASILRSIDTSVDRYGVAMIGEFERHMALGMTAGLTQGEMVELLTGHGGPQGVVSLRARMQGGQVVRTQTAQIPEGLFRRYRSWAWRIVRTETSNAYNGGKIDMLQQLQQDIPGLKKKILAHFDRRTASDSVAVHGQVRDVSGPNSYFQDGAGRVYEHPPARPNDRETVIPWEESWEEVPSTAPLTPEQVQATDAALRAGNVPFDPAERRLADLAAEAATTEAQTTALLTPPAPTLPPGYTMSTSGAYTDVFNAEGVKSGYFKTVNGQHIVSPPSFLANMPAQTFATEVEAALYATQVSEAIAAFKAAEAAAAAELAAATAASAAVAVEATAAATVTDAEAAKIAAKKAAKKLAAQKHAAKKAAQKAAAQAAAQAEAQAAASAQAAAVETQAASATAQQVARAEVATAARAEAAAARAARPSVPGAGSYYRGSAYAAETGLEVVDFERAAVDYARDPRARTPGGVAIPADAGQFENLEVRLRVIVDAAGVEQYEFTTTLRDEVGDALSSRHATRGGRAFHWQPSSVRTDPAGQLRFAEGSSSTTAVDRRRPGGNAHAFATTRGTGRPGDPRVETAFFRDRRVSTGAGSTRAHLQGRGVESAKLSSIHNRMRVRIAATSAEEAIAAFERHAVDFGLEAPLARPTQAAVQARVRAQILARYSPETARELRAIAGTANREQAVNTLFERLAQRQADLQALEATTSYVHTPAGLGVYSDRAADMIAASHHGIGGMRHSASLGSVETLTNMLEGMARDPSQAALLATNERWDRGMTYAGGMSSDTDVQTGGANGVFMRYSSRGQMEATHGSASGAMFHIHRGEMGRLDAYAFNSDEYGRVGQYDTRMTLTTVGDRSLGHSNEVISRGSVHIEAIREIRLDSDARVRVIAELRRRGIERIGRRRLEDILR